MTTLKKIIESIKAVLKKEFGILTSQIKMIRYDVFSIHLPLPTKKKTLHGSFGHSVFVPVAYGPGGIDLTVRLSDFEREFGLMSDNEEAELALKGVLEDHRDEITEVRVDILRDYISDDYVRSFIRLTITSKPDVVFQMDPWFRVMYREGNIITVSVDADVIKDVYRRLKDNSEESV